MTRDPEEFFRPKKKHTASDPHRKSDSADLHDHITIGYVQDFLEIYDEDGNEILKRRKC